MRMLGAVSSEPTTVDIVLVFQPESSRLPIEMHLPGIRASFTTKSRDTDQLR